MRVLSLFDGMACLALALQKAGIPIDSYDAYEIDEYAIRTACHNFPFIKQHGDIFKADFSQYKDIDIIGGGSPCTYWSIAKKEGRETTASGIGWELFQQYVRAVREVKPKYFVYENNKSMSNDIKESITKEFGFEPILINSALVSAQNRKRLYWVGKRNADGTYSKVGIEQPKDKEILLKDILESGVCDREKAYVLCARYVGFSGSQKYMAHRYLEKKFGQAVFEKNKPVRVGDIGSTSQAQRVYSSNGKSVNITSNAGGQGARTGLYLCHADSKKAIPIYEVKNGYITHNGKEYPINLADGFYIIRKLTVRECMRLQTVPEWYEFPVSNTRAYQLLGNGWTVTVVAHILRSIKGDYKCE